AGFCRGLRRVGRAARHRGANATRPKGRAGSTPALSATLVSHHRGHAGLTSVAEVRPRNADAGVRFLRPAPIRRDRPPVLVPRVTSPTAEAMRSDRIQSEFKSPVTHQILPA